MGEVKFTVIHVALRLQVRCYMIVVLWLRLLTVASLARHLWSVFSHMAATFLFRVIPTYGVLPYAMIISSRWLHMNSCLLRKWRYQARCNTQTVWNHSKSMTYTHYFHLGCSYLLHFSHYFLCIEWCWMPTQDACGDVTMVIVVAT